MECIVDPREGNLSNPEDRGVGPGTESDHWKVGQAGMSSGSDLRGSRHRCAQSVL